MVSYRPLSKQDLDRGSRIGTPLPDLQLHLLDDNLQPVSTGVPGEIFVGGAGLARGYRNRAELTAERFIPDPFSSQPNARLYRTGDCARRLPDGECEYLGRLDLQVKVRGFRVELGEVEAALNAHPGIESSAVVAGRDATGQSCLWAYFIARDPSCSRIPDLRAFLSARLPDYMVPAAFTRMQSWPLTTNGKLDRRALPHPYQNLEASRAARDLSAIEERLLAFCREILGDRTLGIDDRLLDAGFHSLAFAQLAWRINREFGVSPGFSEMFEGPTVAELARLVQGRQVGREAASELSATTARDQPLPLSFAQERIWFIEKLHPGNLAYHSQAVLRFHGRLDDRALERALNHMVLRHEILRTTFVEHDGGPHQQIHPFAPFRLAVENVDEARANARIAAIIREPFDLGRLPLARWLLFRLGVEEHWFLHCEHHLLHDGWEYGVFLDEMLECYDAFVTGRDPALPPLTAQFADVAAWQRRQLASGHWDSQLAYWRQRLHAPPLPPRLPADTTGLSGQNFAGAQLREPLSDQLHARLRAAAAAAGVTPSMWLHAAFHALVYRYTGQEDIIVGSGVAARRTAEAQRQLGMLINTVALRMQVSTDLSFRELLTRARAAILEALDNQDIPFDHVVRRLAPGQPLFNVFFDTFDREYRSYRREGLWMAREDVVNNGTCKFDIVALLIPGDRSPPILVWEYDTGLFSDETGARMMRHFLALLAASIDDPDLAVSRLPMLPADERANIVGAGTGKAASRAGERRLDAIFAEVVGARPHAEAAVCADERLTYHELARRSDELADRLRGAGARPGEAIAFSLPRGIDALCAMLAILKCRCAYLPLDPRLPEARRDVLLRSASPALQLTADGIRPWTTREPGRRNVEPMLEGAAYVLFTSGSTGTPKAVCVPHRAVERLVCDVDYVTLGTATRFLQLAPLSFDASTLEIWGPLLNGGVVVFHPHDLPDFADLGQTIANERVTTAWLTASLFNQIIDNAPQILRPLQELLTGGEALSVPHVLRALAVLPETRLINGYGPTETTTFATTYAIPRDFSPRSRRVPIGRPLPDTQVYVLDDDRRPLPIGVPGEIFIGGTGLALGYLGDPDLTQAKFVPDTVSGRPGARLYRTGDRGRLLPDVNLDFIERTDDQLKIRGFRIEPGEIETVLARHPSVQAAVVTASGDDSPTPRLVAYVVPDGQEPLPPLRGYLLERLPDFMVPHAIVRIDALPMTAAGKLDRRALPPTANAGPEARNISVPPRTPIEEVLSGIWESVLNLEGIGVHDDFFLLGGHSLLALALVHKISSVFGVNLAVRLLFTAPTIAGQAQEIEQLRAAATQGPPARYPLVVPLRARGQQSPFFLVAGGFGGEAELLVYARLVRYLSDRQPFYGLRIRGVDDLVEPHESVEALAAEHLQEIRRVQPHGPYFIGGSCVGGVVALEIAQQLRAQGEQVPLLMLVDSRFPSWASLLKNRVLEFWRGDFLPMARSLWRDRSQFRALLDERIAILTDPSQEQQIGRAKTLIGRKYLRTIMRYSPKPYFAPMTLLACEEGVHDPGEIWRDVAHAGLDIESIPGDHFSHLRQHAAVTAARIDASLESARVRLATNPR